MHIKIAAVSIFLKAEIESISSMKPSSYIRIMFIFYSNVIQDSQKFFL